MKYRLKVYSIWEFGKRKDADGNPHQEDCTYPLPNELKDSDRTFILCDGMGGHDAGEVASATVCQAMGDSILNDGHDAEGVFTDEDLKNAIDAAFKALDEKDNGSEKKMGTTMTLLKLHNGGVTIAHMGDSRVYHIRPGEDGTDTEILFETEDHSLVNDLIKIQELTKEEARHSKQKNVITRAMQPCMDRKPNADVYHTSDIKSGDYFYMCSDGMLEQPDMESGESLKNIFSKKIDSAERKVEILTDVTEDNRDNHTAFIIHIEEVTCDRSMPVDETNPIIPAKKMGIVEEDENIPEKDFFHAISALDVKENTKSEHSKENTQTDSPLNKDTENENNENDGDSFKSSKQSTVAVNNTKKSVTHEGAFTKKVDFPKLVVFFIITAIIVAACAIGIKYVSSNSGKHDRDKTELPLNDKPVGGRKPAGEKKKQRTQTPPEAQAQVYSEGDALDAVNSDVAQITTVENPLSTSTSSSQVLQKSRCLKQQKEWWIVMNKQS